MLIHSKEKFQFKIRYRRREFARGCTCLCTSAPCTFHSGMLLSDVGHFKAFILYCFDFGAHKFCRGIGKNFGGEVVWKYSLIRMHVFEVGKASVCFDFVRKILTMCTGFSSPCIFEKMVTLQIVQETSLLRDDIAPRPPLSVCTTFVLFCFREKIMYSSIISFVTLVRSTIMHVSV